jgi:hypothetical protein
MFPLSETLAGHGQDARVRMPAASRDGWIEMPQEVAELSGLEAAPAMHASIDICLHPACFLDNGIRFGIIRGAIGCAFFAGFRMHAPALHGLFEG